MNKKVTAVVLASVLASPMMMARISMAGGDKGSLEFEKGFCIAAAPVALSGGKLKCLATDTRGEAEVEYSQRTKNGITKTKLSAEVELKVPAVNGATGTLPTDAAITITPLLTPAGPGGIPAATFGTPITCTFVNPPTVKDVLSKAIPPASPVLLATKVEFEGRLSQSSDTGVAATSTLTRDGDVSTPPLLAGSQVTVFVDGAAVVTGTLKLDD